MENKQPSKIRRWAMVTFGASILLLLLCALTIFIIDPFQIYRKMENRVPQITYDTQVYSNAGIVRHYAYDSAIVGTSMTENFLPSQLNTLFGGDFLKLVTSGGTAHNHALLLNSAYNTGHDLKRVLYGFDMYSFIGEVDEYAQVVPEYLYDNNPFNDVYYLLNRDVLLDRIKDLLEYNEYTPYKPGDEFRDDMHAWGTLYQYGEEAVMASYAMYDNPTTMMPHDQYEAAARANLEENLLSIIRAHPETEFLIFFPPYHETQWYVMYLRGHLDFVLNIKEIATEELLQYENVKLYDFNAREEWVRNIDYYKDYSHYGPEINEAIAVAIANDENRVQDIYDVYEHNDLLYAWTDELRTKFHPETN